MRARLGGGHEGTKDARGESTMKLLVAVSLLVLTATPALADDCAPITRATAAYAKAERYTVKMVMVSKGETLNTEVMMAPEGMYLKAGEQWIRSPVSVNRKDILAANKAVYSDCKQIGKENIGGVPTAIYRFTGKAEGQPSMTGKLWIGTADDLPRRMEGRTKDGDFTQDIRYDVQAPKGAVNVPGLDQLKGLFGR
jgi:outer membrane lipoprotein-sorting protein